jgi:hypothetical protein
MPWEWLDPSESIAQNSLGCLDPSEPADVVRAIRDVLEGPHSRSASPRVQLDAILILLLTGHHVLNLDSAQVEKDAEEYPET